jgi:hypothetical protein
MNRTLISALAIAVIAHASGLAARAGEDVPAVGGIYLSKGLNPDGSAYAGLVEIVAHGESYLVSWIFPRSQEEAVVLVPTSVGVGIMTGEMLAVSYYGQRMSGVILYRIEEQGRRLAGRWVVAGDGGDVYSETLTRLPSTAPEPGLANPPADAEPTPGQKRPVRPSGGRDL